MSTQDYPTTTPPAERLELAGIAAHWHVPVNDHPWMLHADAIAAHGPAYSPESVAYAERLALEAESVGAVSMAEDLRKLAAAGRAALLPAAPPLFVLVSNLPGYMPEREAELYVGISAARDAYLERVQELAEYRIEELEHERQEEITSSGCGCVSSSAHGIMHGCARHRRTGTPYELELVSEERFEEITGAAARTLEGWLGAEKAEVMSTPEAYLLEHGLGCNVSGDQEHELGTNVSLTPAGVELAADHLLPETDENGATLAELAGELGLEDPHGVSAELVFATWLSRRQDGGEALEYLLRENGVSSLEELAEVLS